MTFMLYWIVGVVSYLIVMAILLIVIAKITSGAKDEDDDDDEPAPTPQLLSASLSITNDKGEPFMSLTVEVGQPWHAKQHEFTSATPDPTKEGTPPGPITYMSDTPTIASVDSTSGVGTAVSVGTATITGKDAGNGLTSSDTLTVVAATLKSASMELAAG